MEGILPLDRRRDLPFGARVITFRSPVLPAGLFGRTFFMKIPEIFSDAFGPPW